MKMTFLKNIYQLFAIKFIEEVLDIGDGNHFW